MVENRRKKAGALACAVLFSIWLVLVPLLYLLADVPPAAVLAILAVCLVLIAAIGYFTWQRFKEIDEGMEDAVDNYREHTWKDL